MTHWPLPYTCYLRVYEPLAAFPAEEREVWRAAADRAAPRSDQVMAESRHALTGLLSIPPRPVPADEAQEAFVLPVDGKPLICPVQPRLRSWVAFGEFRQGLPDELLHAFVPAAAVARTEQEQRGWATDAALSPLRILTATWAVPLHWLAAFAPGDRAADLNDEAEGDPDAAAALACTLLYRARISAARRRVARARRTLRRALGDGAAGPDASLADEDRPDADPADDDQADDDQADDDQADSERVAGLYLADSYADDLEQLGRWLEEFHPRSWLELDYGGLAGLVRAQHGAEDSSVEDVATALAALAAGDQEAAAAMHQRLVERWERVHALQHAN